MLELELRNVLLIKAIEETDPGGELIPLADRATASREALRQEKPRETVGSTPTLLPGNALRLLTLRNERLLQPLLVRHPFLQTLLKLLDGAPWIGLAILLACVTLGGTMSALGGSNRIDILGFPLLLLILWNLGVYLVLGLQAIKGATWRAGRRPVSGLYGTWITAGAMRLLAQSSRFNAPLTAALQRFVAEWLKVARPRLLTRGVRLFHLGSACVASGLVLGLYFRGIWRGYRAGWDSTWPDLVSPMLHAFYGPAAWLVRIALPSAEHLASLRWSAGPGEPAGLWIHLMAVTAVLFIVGPRLLLAAGCTWRVWRLARSPLAPAGLVSYYRTVLSPAGMPPGRGIVSVLPYGYEPLPDTMGAMRRLLAAVLGEAVAVDARAAVPFGHEDGFLAGLPAQRDTIADCLVLLMNLASTPEEENHGAIVVGLRDWLATSQAGAQLLVVIDEGPYASRMTGAPERMSERRALWLKFLKDRGIKGALIDLRPEHGVDAKDPAGVSRLRETLQTPGLSGP